MGDRGRRSGQKIVRDQLSAMSMGQEDVIIKTQPPPTFPPLERHPLPLPKSFEIDYLLLLKQDFVDHMQLSGSYIKLPTVKKEFNKDEEIQQLVAQISAVKEKYDWSLFPAELRPKLVPKKIKQEKEDQNVDILTKLNEFEQMEATGITIKREVEYEPEEEDKFSDEDEDIEEMDEGTDYLNSYFDNGEAYEDEDDVLDDL